LIAAYLDDILISGPTPSLVQDAINSIQKEFKTVNLTINEEKSDAKPKTSVEWLGFIYENGSLSQIPKSI